MVPCTCIDDTSRPETVPQSKWVKKGEHYHITYTCTVLPQRILAVSLYEKPLGPQYAPFEYFAARRFAVDVKDLDKLAELITLCGEETQINLDELMKQVVLKEQM